MMIDFKKRFSFVFVVFVVVGLSSLSAMQKSDIAVEEDSVLSCMDSSDLAKLNSAIEAYLSAADEDARGKASKAFLLAQWGILKEFYDQPLHIQQKMDKAIKLYMRKFSVDFIESKRIGVEE